MFPFIKSVHHFKLQCGITQEKGGEHLLFFFPFYILESELISSNSFNLFLANITVRTRSNSTKKIYWLFTKEIITLATSATSSSWFIFYHSPTVIYILVILLQLFRFIKETSISLSNITKPSLKKISWYLFSLKLKIILNYCSLCVSVRFLEQIYPIRSYHFQNRRVPTPFHYENGNRRPIRYEHWNGVIAIRYDGNIALL